MPSKYTRDQIWEHNGLLGKASMARQAMRSVQIIRSTTPAAKKAAAEIEKQIEALIPLLRERAE